MTAPLAMLAKPVLVYGLTHVMGDAFTPLVASLSKIAPSAIPALPDLLKRRAQMLTDAIDQYGAAKPVTKPAELKQPPNDNVGMLQGPWQATASRFGDLGPATAPLRSFAVASMQRVLASGLPPRDMALLNNAVLMLALGVLSYWVSGANSADPRAWAAEAIDRSGITDALTGDHFMLDSKTAAQLSGAMTHGPARTKALLGLHNLYSIRRLFDAAGNGARHAFGIPFSRELRPAAATVH